ncbi:hypothetical protein GYMLUDRAFT_103822, partial [Collybiopsis luxurians FD-317 M1]
EPGIAALAQKYNLYCVKMGQLIVQQKVPHNAIVPKSIDKDNLFSLDMDNDIWLDIGPGYDDINDEAPPCWLSDDNVCQGICALLERDCCNEERQ